MVARRGVRLAGVALALAVVAGCVVQKLESVGPQPTASTADRFHRQQLTWTPCGPGHDCATALVPLDHADPGGATLTLALRRAPASRQPRRGTLFVNPGGPGVDPLATAPWFQHAGTEGFDVVDWTPRGLNAGATVRCGGDAGIEALRRVDASPDTEDEQAALDAASATFAITCLTDTGRDLLAHVSTADDARDLDILRAAVGDEKLTYYGASYGTLLGALYAEFFPARVGRIVLDSPVDVTGRREVPQSAGFEGEWDAFVRWCAGRPGCAVGLTPDAFAAKLASWLRRLDAEPLPVGARVLTQTDAVLGVGAHLYAGSGGWPALGQAIASALAGDGSALLAAADYLAGRSADGTYSSLVPAGAAIACADGPRRTASETLDAWTRDRASAPVFGELLGPEVGCLAWPVPATSWVTPRAAGAAPILVVGATGDAATPYAWAKVTAATLASGVLVTRDGHGHVSVGRSTCIDEAVTAYLNGGEPPASGLVCR